MKGAIPHFTQVDLAWAIAGKVHLKFPEPDAAKAEAYFERALAVARQQEAKWNSAPR
jgi:hypothetical protein